MRSTMPALVTRSLVAVLAGYCLVMLVPRLSLAAEGETGQPTPPAGQEAPPQGQPASPPGQTVPPGEAASPPPGEPAPPKAWKAGEGLTFATPSGETTLNMGFYMQFRFQWLDYDRYVRSNPLLSSPPIPVENLGEQDKSFDVRRLRVYFRGALGYPWLTYKLELDLVGNDEGLRTLFIPPGDPATGFVGVDIQSGAEDKDGRTVKLLDAYMNIAKIQAASARLGQFKIPHGREELVSDDRLQLPARSIASDFFAPSRDRGALFRSEEHTSELQSLRHLVC